MKSQPDAHGQRTRSRRFRTKHLIPREFIPLLDVFALDSHHRTELWWYALVLLMIDKEQVRMIGMHEQAGRMWVTLEIPGDGEFDIVKPQLNATLEHQLLQGVREIVERRGHTSQRRSK